jgi:hypothetical protein
MHRSGRPTSEQRCCTAEQDAGGAGDSGRLQCGGRAQGGLREGLQGPIKEEAGGLGVRAPVGIAVVIRAEEADRATTRRDSARGKKLLEGGRARETGRWARVRGGARPRAAAARRGGTEGAGMRKKKGRKGMVTDKWGRAEGMTGKEGGCGND